MSYLDVFLINSNLNLNKTSIFYLNIINDSFLHLITFFLPITPLLHTEYNETFSTTFLVAPELVTLFTDYISIYYFNNTFNFSIVSVFDSYSNNLNYFIGEGIVTYLLFLVYI